MDAVRFGARVAHLRTLRAWSLDDLVAHSGLPRPVLARLESGSVSPTLTEMTGLAAALQMPVQELLSERKVRHANGATPVSNRAYLAGLTALQLVEAIERTHLILDIIDYELEIRNEKPLSKQMELANLSAFLGNIFASELAAASRGTWERNGPHKHPDLLRVGGPRNVGIEVKVSLGKRGPKGHLPKPGIHLNVGYVLVGDRPTIWAVRGGELTPTDFRLSNTEGDSGKTAVVSADALRRLDLLYVEPRLCPAPGLRAELMADYPEPNLAHPASGTP